MNYMDMINAHTRHMDGRAKAGRQIMLLQHLLLLAVFELDPKARNKITGQLDLEIKRIEAQDRRLAS